MVNIEIMVGLIAIGVLGAVFIPLAFDGSVGGVDFINCDENEIIKYIFVNGSLRWICAVDDFGDTGINQGSFANENTEFRPHLVQGTNVQDPIKNFGEYSIRVLEYLPEQFGEVSWDYLVPQDYELGEDMEFIVYWFKEDGLFDGSIVPNYNEESTACQSTTTTAVPLNIIDGVEFNFEAGESYLILVNTAWGNDEKDEGTSVIDVRHGSTIFEGSRQQHVIKTASPLPCNVDEDFYKYFWWTLWQPNATEALEDITLNVDNTDNQNFDDLGAILYDDTTISIVKLSENFVENVDYFHNINNTKANILNLWGTESSATISFIPPEDNTDWLVLVTNLNNVTTKDYSYETRLLTSGSQSDILPFVSRQGYAKTTSGGGVDAFENDLHSFSRVFTLANSTMAFPNPIHNYELNGDATDELGGTDIILSDGGAGLNATGWNFLIIDRADIVASDIPDTEYAIEMVFSFTDLEPFPRIADWHNLEGAFNGQPAEWGLYGDEVGQDEDTSLWFWDQTCLGQGCGGSGMIQNVSVHILFQRTSSGIFEAYIDGSQVIGFDDNTNPETTFLGSAIDGATTPQPATFFTHASFYGGNDDSDGFVDCIRVFDEALSFSNANIITTDSDTCFPFPVSTNATGLFTTFTVQTQVEDGETNPDPDQPVPDQRLSNSIFAINLNKFDQHAFVWNPSIFELKKDDFDDHELATISIDATTDDKNMLIIAGVGIETANPNLRTQLDNSDVLPDETFQSYDWEDDIGKDDIGRWELTTIVDSILNGTHTIDIDGGTTGGKNSQFVEQRSLMAVMLSAEPLIVDVETVCMQVRLMSVNIGEDLSSSIIPTHTPYKEVCAGTIGGADILRTFIFNFNNTENPFEPEEVGIIQLKRHGDNSTNDNYNGKVFALFGELQWIVLP